MNPQLLHILQHALGVDKHGQHPRGHVPRDEGDGRGEYYRNHFVTDSNSPDGKLCEQLVQMRLMTWRKGNALSGGSDIYYVTKEGMAAMRQHSPKPPKISRSRQRYLDFIHSELDMSFGDYLRWRSSPDYKERYATP